jgi:hypothetical protein
MEDFTFLEGEQVTLEWSKEYQFDVLESNDVYKAGSFISLPRLYGEAYNYVVAVQFK